MTNPIHYARSCIVLVAVCGAVAIVGLTIQVAETVVALVGRQPQDPFIRRWL